MSLPLVRRLPIAARGYLILAGGLVGAVAGPTGLWMHAMRTLSAPDEWWSSSNKVPGLAGMFGRLAQSGNGVFVLLIPFAATAVLMPLFLTWIERRASSPFRRYLWRAAAAGVGVGVGATMLITFGLAWAALIWGYLHPRIGGTMSPGLPSLIGGGIIFATGTALAVPILMAPYIAIMGIPFGLVFGLAVRKLAGSHLEPGRGTR